MFWMGVLATIAVEFILTMTFAVAMYLKNKREGKS